MSLEADLGTALAQPFPASQAESAARLAAAIEPYLGSGGGARLPWTTTQPPGGGFWTLTPTVNFATTTATAANELTGVWFYSGRGATLSSLGLNISSAVAGQYVRLGVFDLGADGYPTSLVSGSDGGDISAAATGAALASIAALLSPDTWYVAALNKSHSSIGHARNGSAVSAYQAASTGSSFKTSITVAQTYGPMPSTFPTGGTLESSLNYLWVPIALFSAVG